jgi:anti-sigma B factor antagonist
MTGVQMTIEIEFDEAGTTLSVGGEMDLAAADELAAAVDRALGSGESPLIVDLSGVSFIDSTGLGALVRFQNAATAADRELVLQAPSERVLRILELTGLTSTFTIR